MNTKFHNNAFVLVQPRMLHPRGCPSSRDASIYTIDICSIISLDRKLLMLDDASRWRCNKWSRDFWNSNHLSYICCFSFYSSLSLFHHTEGKPFYIYSNHH
jgi:hypothetical protein